jgi:hypothetical protein
MSDNPWETPRHDRPMTHAPVNPTPPYVPPAGTTQNDSGWSGAGFGYAGMAADTAGQPTRKSLWVAIPLVVFLGPLGLFYIGILSGIAGLIVVPVAVRTVAFNVALSVGGGRSMIEAVGIATAWIICIPWAAVGVARRNAKVSRER